MIEYLKEIKEKLFDAPSEVKEAFNSIVRYFDFNDDYNKYMIVIITGNTQNPEDVKYGTLSQHSKSKYSYKYARSGDKWYIGNKDCWNNLMSISKGLKSKNPNDRELALEEWRKILPKLNLKSCPSQYME